MRNFLTILIIILVSFFVLPQMYFITHSQSLNIDEPEVVYNLPYPGILADHPLYFLKTWRDNILLLTTRDNVKKAQLYLHLSDKHIKIAYDLAKKGKEDLANKELIQAEDDFLHIPPLLIEAKKQGNDSSGDFISKLQQSNAKHKEVITEIMKELNEAEIETFKSVLEMNTRAQKAIEQL